MIPSFLSFPSSTVMALRSTDRKSASYCRLKGMEKLLLPVRTAWDDR